MIPKAQMQTVDDKTVISGMRWYASVWYGQLITVGGVGGDFSQTEITTWNRTNNIGPYACLAYHAKTMTTSSMSDKWTVTAL